jgi:hypothetical protein
MSREILQSVKRDNREVGTLNALDKAVVAVQARQRRIHRSEDNSR